MGEVLKVIKETKLGGTKLLIEQNKSVVQGGGPMIHLQTDRVRLELIEPEFLRLAGAVAYARRRFDIMKGWGT